MNESFGSIERKHAGSTRGFPEVPASWFHFCTSRALDRGPVKASLGQHDYAGYRTESGRAVVLSGRCAHLGAYLGNGTICGERLVCPLHGWEFGPDGVCGRVPAQETIPGFARQWTFPTAEIGGHIYFFNRARAAFPMPFYDGVEPAQLLAAAPFELVAEAPWYFVGANGFDLQHFLMAHDRVLMGAPEVSSPSPFARRIVATFAVSGNSVHDRLTRLAAGPQVTMEVTSWSGTVITVRATFARTTTFGIFNVLPRGPERTLGRVIVWTRRSESGLGRLVFDRLNAGLRRLFIRTFLQSDLPRIAGLRYQRSHLIEADQVMADYFDWLATVTNGPAADTQAL